MLRISISKQNFFLADRAFCDSLSFGMTSAAFRCQILMADKFDTGALFGSIRLL